MEGNAKLTDDIDRHGNITKEMMTWKSANFNNRLVFVATGNADEFQPKMQVTVNDDKKNTYTANPLDFVKFSTEDLARQLMKYNLDEPTGDKIHYIEEDLADTEIDEVIGSWTLYRETSLESVLAVDRLRPSQITVDGETTTAITTANADALSREAVANYNASHNDASSAHQHTDKASVILRQTKAVLPDTAAATARIFETTDRPQGNNDTDATTHGVKRIRQYQKGATKFANFGIKDLGAKKQTLTFGQAHGLGVGDTIKQLQVNGLMHTATVRTLVDGTNDAIVDVELANATQPLVSATVEVATFSVPLDANHGDPNVGRTVPN